MTKLNRRSFLKNTAIAGTAAAVGVASTTANAAPKRGGTLRLAIAAGDTTKTFDPTKYTDSLDITMARMVYNQLTRANSVGNRVEPDLAESWEQAKNGLSWNIKLKKGIKFTNGKEFTADDAVYSLKMHMGKKSKSGVKGMITSWKDVKKTGKHSIKIILSSADQDLPWVLNDYHLQIVPNGFKDWQNPIGTGPYKITTFEAGVRIVGKRNEDFHRPNSAWFDKVLLLAITDSTARMNALMSGQVDMIERVMPKFAKTLQKKSNIDLVRSTTGMYYNFPMITNAKPFDDNNVRMAVKYSVPRQQLLDKVLSGYGILGNDHPISPSDEFYNPNIKQRPYDPDKSKYYLKKSGISKLNIELYTSEAAYSGADDAGAIMSEYMRAGNINLKQVRAPSDGYWSNVWMKKPFSACYWGRRPTSAMTFATTYRSGASWNDTFWSNSKFDKLLNVMQTSQDTETRKSASWEMQEILHNDGGQIVPFLPENIDAYNNKKLKGTAPHGIYPLSDHRIPELGWFA